MNVINVFTKVLLVNFERYSSGGLNRLKSVNAKAILAGKCYSKNV